VYEAIEEKFPKDGEGPYSNHGEGIIGAGEDVSFCERAAACGFETFVDTTLEIGHIGEVVIDSAFAARNRVGEFNPWHPKLPSAQVGKPLASIIIPTWNQRPEWLRAAVESALDQTCPVEVIVVDDGSDNPAMWALDGLPIKVRFIELDHAGCFPALNAGIRAMSTDYFTWLSSDDLFKPSKIARQLDVMRNTDEGFSFHGYDVIDGEKLTATAFIPYQWRSEAEQRAILSQSCAINGLTVMIRRDALDAVKLPNGDFFDTSFGVSADWDLWCRLGQLGIWRCIPEILATRRVSETMASARYQADEARKRQWASEDETIRARYSPRCPDCQRRIG
jgi:hypothetical protein